MMGDMTGPSGLITCLADVPLDALIGPVEVLIQEGLTTFALDAAAEAFGDLVSIFGSRASFGATAVSGADQLGPLVAADAAFLLADVATPDLVEAAAAAGLALWPSAMTPTEVRAVLELPVAGAVVFPADVVGPAMGGHLKSLGLIERVVPRGGLGAHSADEWMKAGAPAACVDETLLGDALTGGDLGRLRERCGSFRAVQRKHHR